MTREEAIGILKYEMYEQWEYPLRAEALDMAIKALEQSEPYEDAMNKIKDASFIGNDGLDYVETLVALDALKLANSLSAQPEQVCVANITLTDEQVKEAVEKAKNAVISVIEPEQRWISCSEKLPEIGKEVLLSEPNAMFIAEYYGPENPKGLWLVGGYHHYLADVNRCAWMPLPEPYREEGDK